MKPGDIVLVRFPFSEGRGAKLRPALVLTSPDRYQEIIVAFITSRPPTEETEEEIVIVDPSVGNQGVSNLKVRSAIRLRKLVTIKTSLVAGVLGSLPSPLLRRVRQKLRQLFRF